MDSTHFKVFLWVGLGVLAGLVLNSTISGFLDPILSPAKISVALGS